MSWPVVIAAGLFAVGMMGSDVLYGGLFSLSNEAPTPPPVRVSEHPVLLSLFLGARF